MKDFKFRQHLSDILIVSIIYLFVLISTGIYKINIITYLLPTELKSSANISGSVSLIVSSFISIIFIGVIIGIIFFCNIIFEFKLLENDILINFKSAVYVFIIFELLRFLFALTLLETDLNNIEYSDNFIEHLKSGVWFYLDELTKYLMIFLASFAFVMGLFRLKKYSIINLIIIFFILITGFFISTADVFNTF